MYLLDHSGIGLRKAQIMLFLSFVWLCPLEASAQNDRPTTVAVCNDCVSDFQYSQAAVWAAELVSGHSVDVYVVNIPIRQTLAYRVAVTIIDTISGDVTFEVTTSPISGDSVLMSELVDALQATKDFHDAVIQDIPAEELDLPFDSALDLVGGGLGDANRIRLQQGLADRFSGFETTFQLALEGLSRMVSGIIFGEAGLGDVGDGKVLITFPDATTAEVRVDTVNDLSASDGFLFNIEVDMESIRGPEGQFIPNQAGHLIDFNFTTSDQDLARDLERLIGRLGINIIGSGDSGQNCTTTFTCNGDRCTLTVSC